jgi:hypothetical protein
LIAIVTMAGGCAKRDEGASAPPPASVLAGSAGPSGAAGGPNGTAGTAAAGAGPGTTGSGTTGSGTTGSGTTGSGTTGPGAGATGPAASASATPAGPLDVVRAYYAAINGASQAGSVADVSGIALDGCQTCALDVGATRQLAGRGAHTDGPPYAIGDLTMVTDNGLAATARLTVTMRAYRELGAGGATITTVPAQGRRAGTVTVTLTPDGWRLQNILYSSGE